MARQARRLHSRAFKAKVALAAIKGEKTLASLLAQQCDVYVSQITDWKARLTKGAAGLFGRAVARPEPTVDLKLLHAKTRSSLRWRTIFYPVRPAERQEMIDREH